MYEGENIENLFDAIILIQIMDEKNVFRKN